MQSVAKSWIFKPHVKLKVVSIWRKMEIFTVCGKTWKWKDRLNLKRTKCIPPEPSSSSTTRKSHLKKLFPPIDWDRKPPKMTFDDPKRAVRPVRILNRFHFQMNNLCSVCQAMLIPQGNGVLVSVRPAMMGACALNRALTPDFWCLTGFLCHHLACQRPIRFALQSQCERIPRSWHGFWRCSQPFAMFMWDGDGWQEPERNLNGGSFNGTWCLKCF